MGAKNEDICVCLVSSCGGHLTEVREFRICFEQYSHYYVLNDVVPLPEDMVGKTLFVCHAERDWRVLWNLVEFWRIFRTTRPSVILTTGAGPAVPAAIIGLAFGIPTIFVESVCRVTVPSLTGRIMYYIARKTFYQWESLGTAFPKGVYGGSLL